MHTNNNNSSLSSGDSLGEAYCPPSIDIIKNVYNDGLLTTISLGVSTTPATGGGDAKPGGDWVSGWDDWSVENKDHTW